jgi:hypothetical protein
MSTGANAQPKTVKQSASLTFPRFNTAKAILQARSTRKLETTPVSMTDTAVADTMHQQRTEISTTLGGMVAGVQIRTLPFYKRWWYKIKHIF